MITDSDISRGHSPLGILSKVDLKSEWQLSDLKISLAAPTIVKDQSCVYSKQFPATRTLVFGLLTETRAKSFAPTLPTDSNPYSVSTISQSHHT